MQLTSALVVYAVLWFLTLFCVLPIRHRSQGDAGEVVRGTPASAPAGFVMRRKFLITTLIAFALWVPICLGIIYGVLSVERFDLYHWANPS